jgi:ubiquinone/menaquinone biosynthesis C-methylase UbiE
MRRICCLLVGILWLASATGAQQTALTPAQLKQAAFEAPRLAELLEIKPGSTVADVGAGFGAWTVQFSRLVGPSGRVYATDVGLPQLAALRDWVAKEKLTNVTVIEGSADSTNLPAGCCDAILIRDVYHHLTNPPSVVKSMAEALSPGGRLALIDFPPQSGSAVPSGVPENRGGHGVPLEVALREVSRFLPHARTVSPWEAPNQGQSLYLLLFRKP